MMRLFYRKDAFSEYVERTPGSGASLFAFLFPIERAGEILLRRRGERAVYVEGETYADWDVWRSAHWNHERGDIFPHFCDRRPDELVTSKEIEEWCRDEAEYVGCVYDIYPHSEAQDSYLDAEKYDAAFVTGGEISDDPFHCVDTLTIPQRPFFLVKGGGETVPLWTIQISKGIMEQYHPLARLPTEEEWQMCVTFGASDTFSGAEEIYVGGMVLTREPGKREVFGLNAPASSFFPLRVGEPFSTRMEGSEGLVMKEIAPLQERMEMPCLFSFGEWRVREETLRAVAALAVLEYFCLPPDGKVSRAMMLVALEKKIFFLDSAGAALWKDEEGNYYTSRAFFEQEVVKVDEENIFRGTVWRLCVKEK